MKLLNIFCIIVAIVVVLCMVTEFGYRITKGSVPVAKSDDDSFCVPDNVLGYRFRPGAIAPQGKTVNCINNVGLRGEDISIPKKPNTYRIVCVGDSATNGVNVHNDQTYPAILEVMLKDTKFDNNIQVEVVNAGVPGYLSDHQLYLIERKYFTLEPDLIVFMMGETDVSVILMPTETSDAIRHIVLGGGFLPQGLEDFLQKHSSAYYYGSRQLRDYIHLRRLEKGEKNDLTKQIEESLSIYRNNYQLMINKCRQKGVAVLNINFPWNFTSRVGREDNYAPLKASIKYFEFNLFWQAMPILSKINQEIAIKNHIINVDVLHDVLASKNRLIFFGEKDFSHPNIQGNFLIASRVYQAIVGQMMEDNVSRVCDGIEIANKYLLGLYDEK